MTTETCATPSDVNNILAAWSSTSDLTHQDSYHKANGDQLAGIRTKLGSGNIAIDVQIGDMEANLTAGIDGISTEVAIVKQQTAPPAGQPPTYSNDTLDWIKRRLGPDGYEPDPPLHTVMDVTRETYDYLHWVNDHLTLMLNEGFNPAPQQVLVDSFLRTIAEINGHTDGQLAAVTAALQRIEQKLDNLTTTTNLIYADVTGIKADLALNLTLSQDTWDRVRPKEPSEYVITEIGAASWAGDFHWLQAADFYRVEVQVPGPRATVNVVDGVTHYSQLGWVALESNGAFEYRAQLSFPDNIIQSRGMISTGLLIRAPDGASGVVRAYTAV